MVVLFYGSVERSSVIFEDFDVLGLMVTNNLTAVDLGQGSTTALKRQEFQTTRGIHDENQIHVG